MTTAAKIQTPQQVLDVVLMEEIKAVVDASQKEDAEVVIVVTIRQPPLVPSKTTKNLVKTFIEPEVNPVKTETEMVDRKKGSRKRIRSTIHPYMFSRRQVKVSSKIQIASKWRQNWPNVESANGRSITKMLAALQVSFAGESIFY